MDGVCGNCKYNNYDYDEGDFVCTCEDSVNYGLYTDYDGECEYYEQEDC